MKFSDTIRYVGVNDHSLDLFEGKYAVPHGMAYNSYVIADRQAAVMDSVDTHFSQEWLRNIDTVLEGRSPDYLIVQHMEPDHSGSILAFLDAYPAAKIVASARAFVMLKNFFGVDASSRSLVVGDGDTLSLGGRTLRFFTAAMVHWPEVIMTYDDGDKALFSADAFGKFGVLDAEDNWEDEARRYFFGIVGKYGAPVQAVLRKLAPLDVAVICPLHGPALTENLQHYFRLYDLWSRYEAEEEGVAIAYTSVYGNTKSAAELLANQLRSRGISVAIHDLARCDLSAAVADAFRFSKLVLATTTYNGGMFPFMREFIAQLKERNFGRRTVALIENGSWAPAAARAMKKALDGAENLTYSGTTVTILSALTEHNREQIAALAEELCRETPTAHELSLPVSTAKKFVCKLCGYLYEGNALPADYVCPLCKRTAEDFEEIS